MIILRQKEYSTPMQKGIYGILSGVSKAKSAIGNGALEAKLGVRKLVMGMRNKRTPEQLKAVADRARQIQSANTATQGAIKRNAIKINRRLTTAQGWQQNGVAAKQKAADVGAGIVRGVDKTINNTGSVINSGIASAIQRPGLSSGTIGGKVAMAAGDVTTPYTAIGGALDGVVNLIPGAKMGKIHARQAYQRSNFAKGLEGWSIGGTVKKLIPGN